MHSKFCSLAHASSYGPVRTPRTTFLQRFVLHPIVYPRYGDPGYLQSVDCTLRDLPPLPIHKILVEPPVPHPHQHLLPLWQYFRPRWLIRSPSRLLHSRKRERYSLAF